MKKKLALILCCALSLSLLLAACGDSSSTPSSQPPQQPSGPATVQYTQGFKTSTGGIDDLKVACDQQGTVVSIDYETPAYAYDESVTLTKTAYIYLPYGYDEAKEYNIVYLMHGGGESEKYWFIDERWGETTRNVLDNMIKNGICDPVIVVTPTFNEEGFEGEGEHNAELCVAFGKELRNNLIPAVESQYSTYANGDTSIENLIATREHRAFAGFSMGSYTSIQAGLMQNLDIISYFGSYSGALTTVDEFLAVVESDELKDYSIGFWFNGNGRGDMALEEHDEFAHGVLEAMDRLTDGENFAWINMRDGAHMYGSWIVDLYNSLLVFFK